MLKNIEKMIENVEKRKNCTIEGIEAVFELMEKLTEKTKIEEGLFVRTDGTIDCQSFADDVRVVVQNGEFCLVNFDWDDPVNSRILSKEEFLWIDLKSFLQNFLDLIDRLGKIKTQEEDLKVLEKILAVI